MLIWKREPKAPLARPTQSLEPEGPLIPLQNGEGQYRSADNKASIVFSFLLSVTQESFLPPSPTHLILYWLLTWPVLCLPIALWSRGRRGALVLEEAGIWREGWMDGLVIVRLHILIIHWKLCKMSRWDKAIQLQCSSRHICQCIDFSPKLPPNQEKSMYWRLNSIHRTP